MDLDLYVTDPEKETVYFGNVRSASGGELVADLRCGEVLASRSPHSSEVIFWDDPPHGTYRVGVDFSDACENGNGEVTFRVIAEEGEQRTERTAEVAFERFEPLVLELEVGSGAAPREEEPT